MGGFCVLLCNGCMFRLSSRLRFVDDALIFCGIDPGLNGGVAVIHGKQLYTWTMKELGFLESMRQIAVYRDDLVIDSKFFRVFIEKPAMRPSNARGSDTKAFQNYGYLLGCLDMAGFDVQEIQAQAWQKPLKLKNKSGTRAHKQEIAGKAKELWPDHVFHGKRGGLLDGVTDAVMIAEYGKNGGY